MKGPSVQDTAITTPAHHTSSILQLRHAYRYVIHREGSNVHEDEQSDSKRQILTHVVITK